MAMTRCKVCETTVDLDTDLEHGWLHAVDCPDAGQGCKDGWRTDDADTDFGEVVKVKCGTCKGEGAIEPEWIS